MEREVIVYLNNAYASLCGGSRKSGEPRVQGKGGSPIPERGVCGYKIYGAAEAAKEASKTILLVCIPYAATAARFSND